MNTPTILTPNFGSMERNFEENENGLLVCGRVKIWTKERGKQSRLVVDTPNTVVSQGISFLAHSLVPTGQTQTSYTNANSFIDAIKLGTDGTAVTASDTDLVSSSGDQYSYTLTASDRELTPSGATITTGTGLTVSVNLTESQGNGSGTRAYQEAGLYLSSAQGSRMFARVTFATVTKSATVTLGLSWTVSISS